MKKHHVISGVLFLGLFVGGLTPQVALNAPTTPSKGDIERRGHAIGLLRTINTAERGELSKYGSYASWQTLVAHQSEYLNDFLERSYGPDANLQFTDVPEVLPRWSLRFNLHSDGQGYDVLLEDINDKENGYAVLTDERGLIRECRWLK